MRNLEDTSIEQFRRYAASVAEQLRTLQDAARVRAVAENAAREIPVGQLGGIAQRIPGAAYVGRLPPGMQRQEQQRTAQLDERVEEFIAAMNQSVDAIEDFKRRLEANADLPLDAVRRNALIMIRQIDKERRGDQIWLSDVQWYAGLTDHQASDAVEYWHRDALRSMEPPSRFRDGTVWHFTLTPYGRSCSLDQQDEVSIQPVLYHSEIHNYGDNLGTQQAGIANVAAAQTTIGDEAALHEALAILRQHLVDFNDDEQEDVRENLDAIDEELERPQPRASRIKAWLANIGRTAKLAAKPTAAVLIEATISAALKTFLKLP